MASIFQPVEQDYNTCSCLQDLHKEAALNDFLVFEKCHSEFTLLEALRHQLENHLTTEEIVDLLVVYELKCQLKSERSEEWRGIIKDNIKDLHNNIFAPSIVLDSVSCRLKCTVFLYRFPGMRLESYSYKGSDANSLTITLGLCNGHYVSLKKLMDTAPGDVPEVQVLHHFQDQAATDRQAQLTGHPGQTWIHYKDMSQVFSLAPAEGNIPRSMFNDPLMEASDIS